MQPASALLSIIIATALAASYGTVANAADASPTTLQANAKMGQELKLDDQQDFEDAQRGLIARPDGKMMGATGNVLLDYDGNKFIEGKAPDTVNPSLWRHAKLNTQVGLFKVTDGIYQVRGFDMANMTLIEGKTGLIVADTLGSRESATAALAFARQHLGDKPVTAVIITHSHADHFGGMLGVLSPEQVAKHQVPVIAPEGFIEEATSEFVLAGPATAQRNIYQFGRALERSPLGNVDNGLGKIIIPGSVGIAQPTYLVSKSTEEMTLDGVRFVFHNVPGAEAPAEMTFGIPDKKAYCGAEILTQTMHNLLPVRGAKVRDALKWSEYLDQALEQNTDTQVYFSQHTWPIWGNARIANFIKTHRDVYKYMHDQTVRLMNAGYTPREIAEMVKLPKSLAGQFGARGYYGDVRHNVKAIYQFYLGAYDGNPANLNPLTPQESARHYLELLGGPDKAVSAAQTAFDKGDYRWAAELLNHVVFGQPDHKGAKELLARTYEQMAYMSESAMWRNSYLTAALELRNGPLPKNNVAGSGRPIDMLLAIPMERFLESMAANLNGPDAEDVTLKINLVLADTEESYVLWIENAVLHFKKAPAADDASATLTLVNKGAFLRMTGAPTGIKDVTDSGDLKIDGSKPADAQRFFSLIDRPPATFGIVTK